MNVAGKIVRTSRSRTCRGNIIAETGASMTLLVSIGLPLLLFFANCVVQMILMAELSQVANQAAQVSMEGKYWLGLKRPGYDETEASFRASDAASALAEKIGLHGASAIVTFDDSNPDFDIIVCDMNVNAVAKIPFKTTICGFDLARLFPGNLSARGEQRGQK